MNKRKQHVIKKAHQLFIDKGFQATSIQDILDFSGISKGTFYNYFSSKNELLIALLKQIYQEMEYERNQLLIGEEPSNIEVLIKQIELQMCLNRKNKILALFEEMLISNDNELKQFIKDNQLRMIQWMYKRFTQIFGEDKKPYLLDCAIMFIGILHQNTKYSAMANKLNTDIHKIVRYSMNRIANIVQEVSKSKEVLLEAEQLQSWLSKETSNEQIIQEKLNQALLAIKQKLTTNKNLEQYMELIDFIHDEVFHSINPRKVLIQSALNTLSSIDHQQTKVIEMLLADI